MQPHGLWPTRFSVHGILQARILEWIAMPFSRGSSRPGNRTRVCLCVLHCRHILSHWAIWEAQVGLTVQGQLPNNWQARYSTSSPSQSKASRLHQPDSALALAGSVVYRPATLKHQERCRASALERIRICILTRSPGDSCALWTQRLCSHQPDLQLSSCLEFSGLLNTVGLCPNDIFCLDTQAKGQEQRRG